MLKINKLFLVCFAFSCFCCLLANSSELTRNDVSEEMSQINKSLEGLLGELAAIKREATGRLSQVRNKPFVSGSGSGSGNNEVVADPERIRQTKVSKFVLKRVAELELESIGMRDEMSRLFELQRGSSASGQEELKPRSVESRQEDIDFDDAQPAAASGSSAKPAAAPTTTTTAAAATATASSQTPLASTTTQKSTETEEAAQIGLDLEQLKRLGNELESEIEARQAQRPESLRGVHEQVIKLIDNMVQQYIGNMRRAVQRFQNFVDHRGRGSQQQTPRLSPASSESSSKIEPLGRSIIEQLNQLQKRFRDFTLQWSRTIAKQQSPLIDRIPPRGVELWRDFWDTVRKQVRRINQEFWQISRDMNRMLTGRLPSNGSPIGTSQPSASSALLYSSSLPSNQQQQLSRQQAEKLREQFQEFYDKLTVQLSREQQRMEQQLESNKKQQKEQVAITTNAEQLIDEQDDEVTRNELNRNVALRQQIQQEINVFSSIFDIMRAFIQRLRESATNIRDVLTPPGSSNNNDAVTPGPSIKPTVDQLLEDTINSQRNINGQSKPVLIPNSRPQNVRGTLVAN